MSAIDPWDTSWSESEVAVMQALRDWAAAFDELNGHLSGWVGLPTTDANALGLVLWAEQGGAPLSPAGLARRIGMTTGATSILIDRLEASGHVTRHREGADRRRVTLRATAEARAVNRAFLGFAGQEIASVLRDTDDTQARAARAVLDRMTAAATAANHRLTDRARSRRRSS